MTRHIAYHMDKKLPKGEITSKGDYPYISLNLDMDLYWYFEREITINLRRSITRFYIDFGEGKLVLVGYKIYPRKVPSKWGLAVSILRGLRKRLHSLNVWGATHPS